MEAASLVIAVVSMWRTCVQVFDIVDSGKKYGMHYELLRVKLEVERIRLLTWGEAVGLDDVEQGRPSLHARLNREDVRNAVLGLLGAIQHMFEHSDTLQNRYGLREMTPGPEQADDDEGPPTQSQLILGSIFKRAYISLRKSAVNRQRGTPLMRKTRWAVHDRRLFQEMVAEVKGFNDNLEDLFPGVRGMAHENMRVEIDQSEDIGALQSLQEATSNQHGDISETASVRLEALGATSTRRSTTSEDAPTVTEERNAASQAPADNGNENANENANTSDGTKSGEQEHNELSKQMQAVHLYVSDKNTGALTLSLIGPHSHSARATALVSWDGEKYDRSWPYINDHTKGFTTASHPSFSLYWRRKYTRKIRRDDRDVSSDEDYVFFDIESDSRYEHRNPGTITVEGFGMECWDYEEHFGKKRERTVLVNAAKLPNIQARKLLRRIDELRKGGHKFGWAPEQEEADLQEFFGDRGITHHSEAAWDKHIRVGDLYNLLNRTDVFADFTSESSIGLEWQLEGEGIQLWNFLWQVILAKELARRLEHHPDASISGFTHQVLASLIVQELWLSNAEIILADAKISLMDCETPRNDEERAKAEDFKAQGNNAFKNREYQKASDLYTEAMSIDPSSAVYRANRSAALFSVGKYDVAASDAWIATRLDPQYAKAWARLGIAELKLGYAKWASNAYQRAIDIAGGDATNLMKQGLVDCRERLTAEVKRINSEEDNAKRDELRKDLIDQDWDLFGKEIEFHSHVHEQQVEGLIRFAERMRWPYINELRDYAEDVYGSMRNGAKLSTHVRDWLFGMTLPGKWMSYKIMAVLVLCTPSISSKLHAAPFYDCGLALRKKSFWRVRSALGRVLGCLPRVVSLCGWIGPCPPVVQVVLDNEVAAFEEPRYIRIKARRVSPTESVVGSDDTTIYIGSRHDQYRATSLQPDEEIPAYLAEMKDPGNWVVPEPPVRQLSTCTIESIRLEKLPSDENVAARIANRELDQQQVDRESEYRVRIVFRLDNNEEPVTYKLSTNPVFVTPPPCRAGPKGAHEVHVRELPRYQRSIWTVERLKDYEPEDVEDDNVVVINATGKGAEVLARAWCAEQGKNAVIARKDGPCYVCALRAASKGGGLGVGVVIWVS